MTGGFVANQIFCHASYGLARGFAHFEDMPVSTVEVLASSYWLGRGFLEVVNTARDRLSDIVGDERFHRVFNDDPRYQLRSFRQKNAEQINHDALNWLSLHRGRPFFAFLNYVDVHSPYFPPREADHQFGLEPIPQSKIPLFRHWYDTTMDSNAQDAELARGCYDRCIAYLDDQLGRLFNELETRGLLENTLVIITSDHGEEFGEHGELEHGLSLHQEAIRVPLLVIDPRRVPSGRVVTTPVSLRDLPATVVNLVGVPGPSPFPGRSLARLWNPSTANDPSSADPVLSDTTTVIGMPPKLLDISSQAIIVGDMVYIRGFPASKELPDMLSSPSLTNRIMDYIHHSQGSEELYNIVKDPAEAHNLAGSEDARDDLERLRSTMEEQLAADDVR